MVVIFLILSVVLLVLVGLMITVFIQYRRHQKYFSDKGVVYLSNFSTRSMFDFFKGNFSIIDTEVTFYKAATKTGQKFCGFSEFFTTTMFCITDLDLLRHIYVKDFEYFVNRRQFSTPDSDILMGRMIVNLDNDHWKGMRSKLSPAFTTGKIKRMFNIFGTSSNRMCEYINKQSSANGDFDIYDGLSKFAMDVIASCAFGVDTKTFELDPGVSSEFEQMGRRLQISLKISTIIRVIIYMACPKIAGFFGITPMEQEPQQYFHKVLTQVMKHRRASGERKEDFLQLMMDTQAGLLKDEQNSKETMEVMTGGKEGPTFMNNSVGKFQFEDDDVIANCVLFLIGGFDTTKSLMAFCAYQLAREPEIQEKLYEEVKNCIEGNDGILTYDVGQEMSYMDMFINETLRYYPPATRTERMCTKDYRIPGTNVVIEKGTTIVLPIYGLHHDANIFENPEKFDPERFLAERKNNRHPYAFTPFGHGPRNCIGMRFALTEVKAVIATLVYNFRLEPCSRTEMPVKLERSVILKPDKEMWLNFSPR